MKIVVIGGTGFIGSRVVSKLKSLGNEVIIAAPETGVNTMTGAGLSLALNGAQKVIDLTNSPSFEDNAVMEFFVTSGRNLLSAEASAGVKHHIALSVVGAERLPKSGYLRAKVAQEKIIKVSGIPYSILQSTQFFEFADAIIKGGTLGDTIRLSPALFQPIASVEVVNALVDLIIVDPINSSVEIGGPEKIGMDIFAIKYLSMKKDNRLVVSDAHSLYFGTEINDQSLTAKDNSLKGKILYDDWLRIPGNLR